MTEELRKTFISKSATGTQIMAGSLRLLGNLTLDGAVTVNSTLTVGGAVSLGANTLTTTGKITAGSFQGSGASLTSLPVNQFGSSRIGSANLPTTTMYTDVGQTITSQKTFNAALYFANGTSYYVDTNANAKFYSVTSVSTLTFPTASKVKGSGTGDANTAWLGFYESDGTTRKGFVGDGSTSDSHITLHSDTGDTRLTTTGGSVVIGADNVISVFGSMNISQNLDVYGELKATAQNEFPDPLLMGGSVGSWASYKAGATTIAYDNVQAPVGTGAVGSIKLSATASDAWTYFNQNFDVSGNEWITFSAYVFSTTSGKSAQMMIQWIDSANAIVSHSSATTFNAPTAWGRYSLTVQAPANARYFKVRIDNDGGAGTDMWFSAFQVERGRTLTGFKPFGGGPRITLYQDGSDGSIIAPGNPGIKLINGSNKIQLGNSSTVTKTDGSIGIGVEPSYPLHVKSAGAGAAVVIENGGNNDNLIELRNNGDNTVLVVQGDQIYSNKNMHFGTDSVSSYVRGTLVGLGTTSPDGSYKVTSGGNTKVVGNIDATGNANITGNLYVNKANTNGGGIYLSDDGSIVDNNDGYVSFRFSNGIRITNVKDGNTVIAQIGNKSSLPTYFNHGGSFGINTSSPTRTAEIYQSTTDGTSGLVIRGGTSTTTTAMQLWAGTGGIVIDSTKADLTGAGDVHLRTGGSTRLFVGAGGYVGIGNSNPSTALHVSGHITADRIYATGIEPEVSGKNVSTTPNGQYPTGMSLQYAGGTGHITATGTALTVFGSVYRNFQLFYAKDSTELYLYSWVEASQKWIGPYKFWNSGNMGSGSAMDADLLDGKHSSDLMSATTYREKYIVPATGILAGTSITIPNGRSYVIGSNRLLVFVDGWLQELTDDYTEGTTTTVKFTYDLPEGARISFVINNAG